jgi:SAM-dependent methyltransferase
MPKSLDLAMRVDGWWQSHVEEGPNRIRSFLKESGIELAGRTVADLGCGDGAVAAGLAKSGVSVVGFDIEPVDVDRLGRYATAHQIDISDLPLEFRHSRTDYLPAATEEFDLAVSWSVAEHVTDLKSYFSEASRIVKPYGHLYVQTWPLWYSEHGHHIPHWLDRFDHLRLTRSEVVQRLIDLKGVKMPLSIEGIPVETVDQYLNITGLNRDEWIGLLMESYDSCNRATLDEILRAVQSSGFQVGKVQIISGAFHVPEGLNVPMSQLAISGVEFACWRRPKDA